MRHFLTVTLLLVTTFVALTGIASATVINVAYWRGGENDSPAPPHINVTVPFGTVDEANSTAVDATGNGWNLNKTRIGTDGPYYAYPDSYPVGVGLPASSAVDYAFYGPGNNAFTSSTSVTTGTTNWGVQAWVRPNNTDGSVQCYVQNGTGNGFSLFQIDAALLGDFTGVQYCAEVFGVTDLLSGVLVDTSDTRTWHNLALVSTSDGIGGVTTNSFYVDGVLKASQVGGGLTNGAAATPTGGVTLGSNVVAGQFYSGGIDEARIFTFAPGAFQVSDLNNYIVPEPSTLILLVAGLLGLLAYAWRKRR